MCPISFLDEYIFPSTSAEHKVHDELSREALEPFFRRVETTFQDESFRFGFPIIFAGKAESDFGA